MKHHLLPILAIALLAVVTSTGIFLYGVYEQYMNAIGQRRAILLAETLQKYYDKNNKLPVEFIREINNTGCLSDGKGSLISIDNVSESSFSIRYAPDKDNVLIIEWNNHMKELHIESSIKKP